MFHAMWTGEITIRQLQTGADGNILARSGLNPKIVQDMTPFVLPKLSRGFLYD
jgi:hypothetical protein